MRKMIPCLLFLFTLTSCAYEEGRVVQNFTENWKFFLGDDSLASNINYDDNHWRILDLPHDWSIESDFSKDFPATAGGGALPGGIGWYRKEFLIDKSDKDKKIYIDFDGIYQNSKVWINGHLLGERPFGYISFRYEMTSYIKFGEKNVISVRVDNSEQPNSRWYSGSGIYRNVWLVTTNKLHIDHWGTFVTTPKVTKEAAEIKIESTVRNDFAESREFTLHSILLDAEGKTIAEAKEILIVEAEKTITTNQSINISNPNLWSVDAPYLYKIISRIEQDGKIVDSYETTLGIRYFTFDKDKGFFLNGEHMKIKGVCMHHDLGCLGAAVNIRAMERQLEILKEMGCNSIRTSHNPPAPEWLDLCDRMGFIVMNDSFDMWRKKKSPYDYAQYFSEWHERDLTDFILRDRNHPSVFMWNIGNEVLEQWSSIDADTLSLQQANLVLNFANTLNKASVNAEDLHVNSLLTIKLADIVKSLDPTRPVTSGNNEPKPHNHLLRSGAMDIVGINYHEADWLSFKENFPDQKLIVSEATSGLMSRGYYEMPSDQVFVRPERWDKPFIKEVQQCSSYDNSHVPWGTTHEKSWNLVKKNDYISGTYVWTGFDYLGEPTPFWWPSRSSYFGIVDLAGFPKDIYYMYQSEWTDKDLLHIFPHWNWQEGEIIDVWAYYNNADEVELFLNGKSLGRKSKTEDSFHVSWRVPFEKGELKAISYKNGKPVLTKTIKTVGEAASIRLTADRISIKSDAKDLAFVTVEVLDAEGTVLPTADNFINFEIEGEGFIAGTDNGDPTEHLSLKKPQRKLFNGKALVVIQSKKKSGKITLKANSEGLKKAQLNINTD